MLGIAGRHLALSTTAGSPRDVTLAELTVEPSCLADAATEAGLRAMA